MFPAQCPSTLMSAGSVARMSFEFFVRRYGHSKTASFAACSVRFRGPHLTWQGLTAWPPPPSRCLGGGGRSEQFAEAFGGSRAHPKETMSISRCAQGAHRPT